MVSLLVNDNPIKEFNVGKGIRQDDSLLIFLFLLVVEGFNLLTKRAIDLGNFYEYGFERWDDCFLHIYYVDDTLIIVEKNWGGIKSIKVKLILFEMMLGLKVNFHKRCIIGINIC